jgi:hypothetical protein
MADCCFPAERRSVDEGTTSQLARLHVVPLRPGKGAADRCRSSSSDAAARLITTALLAKRQSLCCIPASARQAGGLNVTVPRWRSGTVDASAARKGGIRPHQ